MVGMQNKKRHVKGFDMFDSELAEELNKIYLRFDVQDFNNELSEFQDRVEGCMIQTVEATVYKSFSLIKERKSPGPDRVGCKLLKSCARQQSVIFTYMFQSSLEQQRVGIYCGSCGQSHITKDIK